MENKLSEQEIKDLLKRLADNQDKEETIALSSNDVRIVKEIIVNWDTLNTWFTNKQSLEALIVTVNTVKALGRFGQFLKMFIVYSGFVGLVLFLLKRFGGKVGG